MSSESRGFDRGTVLWISLDPSVGREQKGLRPVLVLTEAEFNASGKMIACSITRNNGFWPTKVPISVGKVTGYVLVEPIRMLDYEERGIRRAGCATDDVLNKVNMHLRNLLKLHTSNLH